MISRQIILSKYPKGLVKESDFRFISLELPPIRKGEVLVRNKWMTVTPAMRIRMNPQDSYLPPYKIGEVLSGQCVGVIEKSNNCNRLPEGTLVFSQNGWRDCFISDGSDLTVLNQIEKPYLYLSILGLSSMTAYIGIEKFSKIEKGDVVFVSAASGSVGSVACQLAKMRGAIVVGSAGRDDKVDWLYNKAKVDKAINYKQKPILKSLSDIIPQGINVYFDNVGGDHLIAAMKNMNNFGRIIMCGMLSQYNQVGSTLNLDLFPIITKRLTMYGYVQSDHMNMYDNFIKDMYSWYLQGKIFSNETIVDGIELAPRAFIDMLAGQFLGKVIIRL